MGRTRVTKNMLLEQPVGVLYAWWRGDDLPLLAPPPDLTIEFDPVLETIQRVVALSDLQIDQRLARGNRAVVGRVDGAPAAIGWSTSGRAEIGELGLDFELPTGNRYLWDFVTLSEWRGRAIYPALLQAFIRHEAGVERFWVGHDLDNVASGRGILKAGFRTVGQVYLVDATGPVFAAGGMVPERAEAAAILLDMPLVDQNN
ncbi:hypothetical protein BH23CHL2_BH23CHL2_25750 [soil metagenome]